MLSIPPRCRRTLLIAVTVLGLAWVTLSAAQQALGQTTPAPAAPAVQQKGFWEFLTAGGVVGYAIIGLSFLSAGLVIDSFSYVRLVKLVPPGVVEQAENLARRGRFSEVLTLCKAGDSLYSRVLQAGMAQGALGVAAVRQAMQEQGLKEFAKLNQRVGYMGFIGSIGPMAGLLGTVLGMVNSFQVLGASKGTARPDELAQGIAYALVTTCEGLVVAIPMMFFHNFFRDRVTKVSNECSGDCERFLRIANAVVEARMRARPMPAPGAGPAMAHPQVAQASPVPSPLAAVISPAAPIADALDSMSPGSL
jgi:biopolymer transport protein ExbB